MQTTHPFERAGLGKAPFRFIGMEKKLFQAHPGAPLKAGSSCDYCATAIAYEFWIKAADGRQFKVGCDCVMKVSAPGKPLYTAAEREMRKIERANRETRAKDRIDAALAALAADAALLRDKPHPHPVGQAKGETLRESVEWLFEHAGQAGRLKAAKIVESALRDPH